MPAAAFIPMIIGAGATVAGSAIAAHGARSAANTQAQAGRDAADLFAPYRQAGAAAVGRLNADLSPGGTLAQPFGETFTAPTEVTEQNDPGFKFRLQEGQKALERSAAARGTLLTGGTAKAVQRYGQDYASNEYGNVYNRAIGEFQQRYNIFRNTQSDLYNREAGLANLGYAGTGQAADYATSGAAADAAGTVGAGNAWNQGLGSLAGIVQDYGLLNRLFPKAQQPPPAAPSTASAY